jgi:hypothetical protein
MVSAQIALKMAGNQLGLFTERNEITHLRDFDDLSDCELVVQKFRNEALEHREREVAEKTLDKPCTGG